MASAGGSILSQGASSAKSLLGQAASTLSPANILGTAAGVGNAAINYGIGKMLGTEPSGESATIIARPTVNSKDFDHFHQCRIYCSNIEGVPKVGETLKNESSMITLWLENEVGFQSTTEWDQPFKDGPLSNADGAVGAVLKAMRVAGVSPITQSQLRKVWSGVADFNVTMRFSLIAESSYEKDILLPLLMLLKLQAPSKPSEDSMGFINPPGPKLRPREGTSSVGGFVGEVAKQIVSNGVGAAVSGAAGAAGAVLTGGVQLLNQAVGGALDGAVESTSQFTDAQFNKVFSNIADSTKGIEDALEKNFYTKNQITVNIGNFLTFPSVYISEVSPTFNVVLGPAGKPMRCNIDITFSPLITPLVEDYATILMAPNAKEA